MIPSETATSKDRKDQQIPNQRLVAPQANLVEDEIIVAVVVKTNLVEDKSAWIMKSGASRHLCNNKRLFHQFEEVTDGGQVYIGNNGTARVVGKGKVFLKFTSGKILALNNVLYVPSLRRNMVFGSLLVRAGLKVTLEGDKAKPTEKHLNEVKRIFRYLRGTVNTSLQYTKDSGFELTGFSYADYAGCKDSFKSTSGGAQFLGEKLVSWSLKKQDCTALSIAEAEYVSLSACWAQVL
nr:Ty1-copia retrotransposon protein [Tanacetum cinerariifolium]